MQVRVVDLDRSVSAQQRLLVQSDANIMPVREDGPELRLACSFRRFHAFERCLTAWFDSAIDDEPAVTFLGSGDFHHLSLALLRRQPRPFNLLVIDNHPDWMRGVPFLHCGTWLNHAARLPMVRNVFHVGGNMDFDNAWRWLAPWDLLRSGHIAVFPAMRSYQKGRWFNVVHDPLRRERHTPVKAGRFGELLAAHRDELARWPLYISIDKDVMRADDAVVNWDSGHLTLPEVTATVEAFVRAARGDLIGADIVGDWSPVVMRGLFRRFLHWIEHPSVSVDADAACRRNDQTNRALLTALGTFALTRRYVGAAAA
jgi:hypothetical protein